MSTLQIEGLWQYIQTLSLSNRNKKWLADRLIENINATESSAAKKTKAAIKEAQNGQVTSYASFEDFKKQMYEL